MNSLAFATLLSLSCYLLVQRCITDSRQLVSSHGVTVRLRSLSVLAQTSLSSGMWNLYGDNQENPVSLPLISLAFFNILRYELGHAQAHRRDPVTH